MKISGIKSSNKLSISLKVRLTIYVLQFKNLFINCRKKLKKTSISDNKAARRINGISIVLPSYNSNPEWLSISVNSCLTQSQDWPGELELIIVDDGSDSPETIEMQDKLSKIEGVKLIRLTKNYGLPTALNKGIDEAKWDWIARQDDDDISSSNRFSKQIEFLESNSDCKILGTTIACFKNNKITRLKRHPEIVDLSILKTKKRFWFFNHPTAIIEKSFLKELGGYCPKNNLPHMPEDWSLWIKILEVGEKIYNLDDILHFYRLHKNSLSQKDIVKKLDWMQMQLEKKQL